MSRIGRDLLIGAHSRGANGGAGRGRRIHHAIIIIHGVHGRKKLPEGHRRVGRKSQARIVGVPVHGGGHRRWTPIGRVVLSLRYLQVVQRLDERLIVGRLNRGRVQVLIQMKRGAGGKIERWRGR